MIPELGHLALIVALAFALLQGTLPLIGAARGKREWIALARPLSQWQAACVGLAFALLAACFVRNDFSVLYVAQNSNSSLPLPYRIAATWGGHEGSLLLWVLMLGGWTLAVGRFSRALPAAFVARILAVLGLVACGFIAFLLLTSNPFERLLPAAPDGRDLNPLLQDPGMVFHPPMLYLGYVGFAVAFAFAIAALIGGELDATWARWTKPWTTAAWIFLTGGIALGSWWAYNELGWGGWWFWDPVENASFMPWLVGTALMHSLAVTEKRDSFKAWTVLLAILAFSLSLLGTFLVRSGVLSSVHAFATDPRRGLFILAFLVIVIGASLLLYAWRAPRMGLGQRFGVFSKEALLLLNNMLLAVAAGAVLLGTLYPLVLDALGLGKISVGPPYFDKVFGLLMLPVLLLLGGGPLVKWKSDRLSAIAMRLRWAAPAAVIAAVVVGAWAGSVASWSVGGFALAFWVLAGVVVDLVERLRARRAGMLPRAVLGMLVAHLGVAAFAFGVAMVKTHELQSDVKMGPGDSAELGGYRFTMTGLNEQAGPNYDAVVAQMEVTQGGRWIGALAPQKRVYRVQRMPMTEAAVLRSPWRDLYVSMGEPLEGGAWVVRLQLKPFVSWIWGGCLVMMAGGWLAASDRRYRTRRSVAAAVVAPAVQGAR
jgi:cytochrome c-type biogenesis protein CcmF